MVANAIVHKPPRWLRKLDTKASFRLITLARGSFTECEHVMDALVKEVSILSPGTDPAEPLARVLSLRPAQNPALTPAPQTKGLGRPDPAGSVTYGGPIIRRVTGQVLGVR